MADVLIAYDVSANQIAMKAELKRLGYMDSWQGCNLPNTTMWKKNSTAAQGKVDMESVSAKLGIVLERAVAVEFSNWAGVPGRPHS